MKEETMKLIDTLDRIQPYYALASWVREAYKAGDIRKCLKLMYEWFDDYLFDEFTDGGMAGMVVDKTTELRNMQLLMIAITNEMAETQFY